MIKALLLFSKGLDSLLVKEILERQNIKVETINFGTCFFNGEIDITEDHLKIVKNPKYGRGQGMNPCRDCHLLMLKKAGEIMKEKGYDFIATGEVVSQRPFSQSKEQLLFFDKEANLEGLVLRPLSAKLLPETIPEKKGLIDRNKLYDISGKSRKKQLELAKQFNIKDIPMPAGGCILTDKEYSKKLKELLFINPEFDSNDAKVLTKGRVFFKDKTLFIITRNEKEGEKIKDYLKRGDIFLEPQNFPGPSVLIRDFTNNLNVDIMTQTAKDYLIKYSKKVPKDFEIKIQKYEE
ncbi:MAG: tRNA 4-thiouridine(8) synthase ThiI [Candidatus Pacebacteria bacterium]|nr:tRNA 4-thiouridine(8) synthase ThiI [Candidatus Paceibacterota bacterium]